LEVLGDLIHEVGTELRQFGTGLRHFPPSLRQALADRVEGLDGLLTRTMDAFGYLSVVEANATLNEINDLLEHEAGFRSRIARQVADRKTVGAAQRIVCALDTALEMLGIANEVTINRSVEPQVSAEVDFAVSPVVARAGKNSDTTIAIRATLPA
jgi:hypothetical protein